MVFAMFLASLVVPMRGWAGKQWESKGRGQQTVRVCWCIVDTEVLGGEGIPLTPWAGRSAPLRCNNQSF